MSMFEEFVDDGYISSDRWWRLAATRGLSSTTKTAAAGEGNHHTIGEHPDGFGKTYVWPRNGDVTLIAFINPADYLGVAITGIQKGDEIEISSAGGLGYFDADGAKFWDGFIGVIGAAAGTLLPGAKDIIDAGEKWVKEIVANAHGGARRDVYGNDGDDYEKCEGGILVCMPAEKGVRYSTKGCCKEKLPRTDDMRPDHIRHSHFLVDPADVTGHVNRWKAKKPGEAYIVAWDRKFSDNEGYYKLFVKLHKGT
ncbi:MAG: hypothetical protein RJP95_02350 [Pirellulales bacterium]